MEVLTKPATGARNDDVAKALRANRASVAEAFARAFEETPKWKAEAAAQIAGRGDYIATNFFVFADYLIEYFDRGDDTFRHLFVGETIKGLYDPSLDDTQAREQALAVCASQRSNLSSVLRGQMSAASWATFESCLVDISRTLTAETVKTQRLLLVGDCIFLDIVPFIVAELLEAGIRVIPDYAASKNPAALRDQLRSLSSKHFDLVFFSPFSYEFSQEYAQLMEWRRALMDDNAVRDVVQNTWDETRQTIDFLADLFDCPIHIHNSAAVVREESPTKRLVKMKATSKIRSAAKQQINGLLAAYLEQKNSESFSHLFLFDEDSMVAVGGELEAGSFFYKTALQHPVMLGKILAAPYVDLIFVNAWLLKKKVVVCDLDNTLWDGVIGEGAVAHFHDRQSTLIKLKRKGVVLAINSKNDPANVHWRGGTLSDDDFVSAAISWDPKVQGMKRIQASLNLKMKDYVFIDDREDERELMHMTYPEILCLDATVPATWRRFDLWSRLLEEDLEMDRTLMYKQREARKAFIKEDVVSDDERAELFESLQLKLDISEATPDDLKRIAELINRTNQFNLEGSRTSFREVTEWHESPNHLIVIGQTSDRFGDMGTTCVAVAHIDAREMRLLPFVLSCRVFGYGIEHGVMDYLKGEAIKRGATRIVGRYLETPQNAPCKDFLAESGFVRGEQEWSLSPQNVAALAPKWLAVTRS